MIARPLFTAAALALLAAAPAMAGSSIIAKIDGYDDEFDGQTRYGAHWSAYERGSHHVITGHVAGPGTHVTTANLGQHATSDMDVTGYGNQIDTVAQSHSSVAARIRGDRNKVHLDAGIGTHVEIKMDCDQCYIYGNMQ